MHSLESFCKSMSLCNFWLIFGNIALICSCQPYMNDRKGSTNCLVELVIATDVFFFYVFTTFACGTCWINDT